MSCFSKEDIAEIGHLTITKKGQKTMSKERLVELLGNAPIGVNGITLLDKHEPKVIEEVADYLIANGVIVPPCTKGDVLKYNGVDYTLNHWNIIATAFSEENRLHLFDIEEAEQALEDKKYER